MPRYVIKAPAKINLFLHVVGKAPFGYHFLESVFAFVGLCDILEVDIGSKRRGVEFVKFSGISKSDNTVKRAISHMVRRCAPGISENVYVKVIKSIPVAAGLAGGSADAAAIIRLLSKLWGISEDVSRSVALRIGSDVPVCLESKTAFVKGTGEVVHLIPELALPEYVVLVGADGVSLSTGSVFRAYSAQEFSKCIEVLPEGGDDWWSLIMESRNDLTEIAVSLVPEIKEILSVLQFLQGCRIARMTGSGAMCFALFESQELAESAVKLLRCKHPGWKVYGTKIL